VRCSALMSAQAEAAVVAGRANPVAVCEIANDKMHRGRLVLVRSSAIDAAASTRRPWREEGDWR